MLSLQNLQNMMGLSGEGGGGGLNYLIQEEFTSADTAPLTDPRVAEPGPGSFDITNAANLSIAGGKLVGADGATAGLVSASAVTIGNGLAIKFDRTRAENSGIYAGLNSVQALPSGYTDLEYGFNGAVTIYTGEFVNDPNSIAVAKLAIIFDDTNVYYFANNTALGDVWTLLWVRAIKTTGSHYVVSAAATAAGDGDFEYIRAVDDFITSIFSESIDYENVGAYLFDGVDDVIEAANSAAITSLMASGGSVSFWLNPSSDGEGNDGYILNKEGDWRIVTTGESGGNIALRFIQRFSSTNGIWDTDVNIPIGSWTHFAIVYDNGATTNDPVFYVNGVSVTVNETDTPVGTAETSNSNDLNIGNWGGLTKAYDGYVSDIKLFSTGLSAAEADSVYKDEVITYNPVRWYKCDEGSGTTATDEMGDASGTISASNESTFHAERTVYGVDNIDTTNKVRYAKIDFLRETGGGDLEHYQKDLTGVSLRFDALSYAGTEGEKLELFYRMEGSAWTSLGTVDPITDTNDQGIIYKSFAAPTDAATGVSKFTRFFEIEFRVVFTTTTINPVTMPTLLGIRANVELIKEEQIGRV